ncbi:MAG: hypothetical protein Q4A31_04460 [Corynebacterium sp.]|uniref:hypothetical protein n=1 Tax=Corynebacterium sp. TaxID=1720 RepID=UPI0026DD3399|nr:hypothetical protein [Corynebacterium sp.]MDO4761148.1 hypothetical protein [Corynebacterium sp.]
MDFLARAKLMSNINLLSSAIFKVTLWSFPQVFEKALSLIGKASHLFSIFCPEFFDVDAD